MKIEDAIKNRKSVRRYSDKKPDWRKIVKAIDAARYAPMAGNMFSAKFILVKDKKKIEKIGEACQQNFIHTAQYIVVVVSDDKKLKKSYNDLGEKYARQQAGASIENFLLELVSQGLVTCWIGYFSEEQIKKELKIPDEMVVEALFPIGIETEIKTKGSSRPELDNILYFDSWKNKYMKLQTRTSLKAV